MKIRGRRRCKECGTRWSYYETGDVACPNCGSVVSVGTDEKRRLHTDAPVELDLTEARAGVEDRPLRDVAEEAAEAARTYVLSRGFVNAGGLQPLDDVVLAAAELRSAAAELGRSLSVTEEEERYFLALLRGAEDGERPAEVPDSLREARGLAAVDAVGAYREDLSAWLDEYPDPAASDVLEALRPHEKRIGALDGDVPPPEADRLVAAARDLGAYLRDDDGTALSRARDRIERLD